MIAFDLCFLWGHFYLSLDKNDPIENKGQMQSSFKDFEKKIK